jgi:spore germination protein YaaH
VARRTAAVFLLGLAALFCSPGAIADPPTPQTHYRLTRIVTGWLPYWENKGGSAPGWSVVGSNLNMLDQVSFFSAQADTNTGALTLNLGADGRALDSEIVALHMNGVQAFLTVTHFDHIHELLSNPAALQAISDGVAKILWRYNFDGVDIDFEDFHDTDPADAARYTAFMTELADRLHQRADSFGYPITVAATILARTSRGRFTYCDETALANSPVDQVRVMAYDEFSPGSKKAGACAPLPWVEQVAAYLRGLDAPIWKFEIGFPGYGYVWPVVSDSDWTTTGKGKSITYPLALKRMADNDVKRRWDADQNAPYFSYIDNGRRYVGFYEDAYSWDAKLRNVIAPASADHAPAVGGLCEWAFGDEEPEAWNMVRRALKAPYPVTAAIGQCYTRFGGGGRFGEPLEAEQDAGPNDPAQWTSRAGRSQQFRNAVLYYKWDAVRAYYVAGELLRLYINQGGADGPLGFPIGDPSAEPSGKIGQMFEHGSIECDPNAKAIDAAKAEDRLEAGARLVSCACIAAGALAASRLASQHKGS